VWTPEALREMSELTDIVTSSNKWERTCFAESSTVDEEEEKQVKCASDSILSPLLMFAGTSIDYLS